MTTIVLEGMQAHYYMRLDDVFSHVHKCKSCEGLWDMIAKHKVVEDRQEKKRIASENTGPVVLQEKS